MLKFHPEEASVVASGDMAQPIVRDAVVEINGLTKRYGRKAVVDELSLSIPRGSVYGLIGPNGAGKSTTLKSLMRLIKISAGSASILGHDVHSDFQAVKGRLGYVPETHHIYRWMKVKRVIAFTRSFYPAWNDEFCGQMLQMMELDPNKKVKQLSKGMLAKLALLLAVSHEPELLVLDEPLSGLDPIVRDEFIDGVLKTICERDTTVIFSSHTIGDIQRLADSVGILFNGRLLVNDSTETIVNRTKRIQVVLNDNDTTPCLDWLPKSVVHQTRSGRELNLTIADHSEELLDRIRREFPEGQVSVSSMNLEDIFKAHVRGAKTRISNQTEGRND